MDTLPEDFIKMVSKNLIRKEGMFTKYVGGPFNRDEYQLVTKVDKSSLVLYPNTILGKDNSSIKRLKIKQGDILRTRIRPSKKYKNLLDIKRDIY